MVRRQRKSPEERREQILQVAGKLFVERGFDHTTTKEIAHAADIAEGTIYKYFASKQEILFMLVKGRIFAQLEDLFDTTQNADDAQIIRTFIRMRFDIFDQHGDLVQMLLSEVPHHPELLCEYYHTVVQPALNLLRRYITDRIAAGSFRSVNPTVVARSLAGALIFNHLIFDRVLGPEVERVPREELIDELAALFLHGMMKEPVTTSLKA